MRNYISNDLIADLFEAHWFLLICCLFVSQGREGKVKLVSTFTVFSAKVNAT